MKKINIAIDGYAGCGKSTLARDLAKAIGYTFVDSGAMYRGITAFVLDKSDGDVSEAEVARLLEKKPKLEFEASSNNLILNGVNVESTIRTSSEIANAVSDIAALASVRSYLKGIQQSMTEQRAVVMEGRDIGTMIMPDAELKLFITASLEERISRRLRDLEKRGVSASREEVAANLSERDRKDAQREVAPLRKADDAIVLDTSLLNRDEQLRAVVGMVLPLIDPEGLLPFIQ